VIEHSGFATAFLLSSDETKTGWSRLCMLEWRASGLNTNTKETKPQKYLTQE
jgi:hypothetical protein